MKSQHPAHHALNLSYVLHERSDSQTVQDYVRRAEAERRRRRNAIRELAQLSREELGRRLVVLEPDEVTGPSDAERRFISVNLGAIELLPRLLNIAGHSPMGTESTIDLLDAEPAPNGQSLNFFGAPATLNAPKVAAESAGHWLFASAVLRPGYASILLRLTPLDVDPETRKIDWGHAVRLAEEAVREFPLQWWCKRALWPRPAEQTLPEFQAAGNGVAACGR